MSTTPPPSVPHAMLWMSGALLSFTTMALAGREMSSELTLFQILFMRSLICLAVLSLLATRLGLARLATRRPLLHLGRNGIHYAASYLWMLGVISIPLTEVFAIEFTTPIWTAILAALFLREPLTRVRLMAIALGFLGVLIILRPGAAIVHPAAIAVLGSALGYAAAYVFTKQLSGIDRPIVILFYMNLIQFAIGLGPSYLTWVTPSPALWPWIAAMGVAGLTSHYCVARAMAFADATVVVPLDFLRLPLIAVVGYLLYAEPLDPFVLAGAVLVVGGNLLNLFGNRPGRRD